MMGAKMGSQSSNVSMKLFSCEDCQHCVLISATIARPAYLGKRLLVIVRLDEAGGGLRRWDRSLPETIAIVGAGGYSSLIGSHCGD